MPEDHWFLLESPVVCWPLTSQGDGVLEEQTSWCEGCLRAMPERPATSRPRREQTPARWGVSKGLRVV